MEDNALRTKKILKWMTAISTVLLILKVSYDLKWIDLVLGIFKLETKDKPIQKVSFKSLSYIGNSNSREDFFTEMHKKGWHFVKCYGNGMIFDKDGYEILITHRNYFNRYTFYEVTTKEVFDVI